MSYRRSLPAPNNGTRVVGLVPRVSLAAGAVGALFGGAGAAAMNIRRVRNAEISREEAVTDTIREAAGSGLATAAATAVVGAVGVRGLLAVVGLAVVATGTKYMWDGGVARVKSPSAPAKAKPEPEPEMESEGTISIQ